jgi:hypothetical protein
MAWLFFTLSKIKRFTTFIFVRKKNLMHIKEILALNTNCKKFHLEIEICRPLQDYQLWPLSQSWFQALASGKIAIVWC